MIIGIDPGYKKGAIAIVGNGYAEVHDLPTFEAGGVDCHALSDLLNEEGATHIYIESVHAMPKQGVSSSFNFGSGVGQINAVATLSGVPVTYVTPGKWKKHFRLPRDKDAARKRAIELFPKLSADLRRKKDADRAEALLIAKFGEAQ